MLVIGDDILDHLIGAKREHIINASYYLTIGAVIPVGKAAENFDPDDPPRELTLAPGHVAWVVSRELFAIKSHAITGLVTLRSSMTKEGLLALDVGIVDPTFQGPIGSIVINFSKNSILLSVGQEFFRVIFIQHDEVPAEYRGRQDSYTAEGYTRKQREMIVSSFPETFLNRDELIGKAAAQTAKEIERQALNNVLALAVRKYGVWVVLAGFVGLGVICALLYLFWTNFGLTHDQIQALVNKAIEQRVAPPAGK